VAKHFGALPQDVSKAIYRARKYLERAGLSQSHLLDDSTLSRVATLLDLPRAEHDDEQEMCYKELLVCRSNVGSGNDREARDQALALKAIAAVGNTLFDERVRLYCDQILFIVGESMAAPNPAGKLQAKADALLRGWAVQRDYLNVAITLIERAHTYRLNEHFGEIERDGKTFDQMQVFLDNREKVLTSIGIPQRSPDLYGSDIRHMRERKLTFDEAISVDLDFNIVEKWRLNRVRRELFEQLAQTPFA
jgi:hypothetical protein